MKYGWRPSLSDPRNIPADVSGIVVAHTVDPRPQMPQVYDQGQLGSCTANAVAGAIEYDAILSGKSYGTPSRLFIYYGERELEGSLGQGDTGATGHDGFKVARRFGTPPETDWPYKISQFEKTPPNTAYTDASKHRITQYRHPAQSQYSLKAVLSNRQLVAFGFTVFESFESDQANRTGVIPMPNPNRENILGGHEILIVGYDEAKPEYALCRNSWGTGWGDGGYCWFPWSYLLDSSLCSDFRCIYRAAGA